MNTSDIIAQEEAFQIRTYKKLPIALERGKGSYVWDADGTRYLDFYGGHCVTALGHCPDHVVNAVQAQTERLMFYSNVVYSSVRAEAAQKLAAVAPVGLGHIFFCNSGTEANETALKLARKWTGKSGIISTVEGSHGRTLGSLATTWAHKYRDPYQTVLPSSYFVPFGDADAVADVLQTDNDVAAVILEPIQSMAGIQTAPASYFEQLRTLCDRHQVALIYDEVQTGVGRTGTFSIADSLGVKPDLITMAKSLGSGLPVGATFASDVIAETVEYGDQGSTFGGGMLAMAAVSATVDTLLRDGLMERAGVIFGQIATRLGLYVKAVRGQGCLIGIELDGPAAPVLVALRENGILAGSAVPTNTIRLMPALNTTDEEIAFFCDTFLSVLQTIQIEEVTG
jgi:acetylornithine/succinyldiaminopimelate/putrescine aminotransferase